MGNIIHPYMSYEIIHNLLYFIIHPYIILPKNSDPLALRLGGLHLDPWEAARSAPSPPRHCAGPRPTWVSSAQWDPWEDYDMMTVYRGRLAVTKMRWLEIDCHVILLEISLYLVIVKDYHPSLVFLLFFIVITHWPRELWRFVCCIAKRKCKVVLLVMQLVQWWLLVRIIIWILVNSSWPVDINQMTYLAGPFLIWCQWTKNWSWIANDS